MSTCNFLGVIFLGLIFSKEVLSDGALLEAENFRDKWNMQLFDFCIGGILKEETFLV